MPTEFVADNVDNQVDLVQASTGRIVRVLLRGGSYAPITSLAATSTDVYAGIEFDNPKTSSSPEIMRIPRSGGTPTAVAQVNASAIVVSPDEKHLAWVDGLAGTYTSINPLTVSVQDLKTGVINEWSLNSLPHTLHGRSFSPDALGWYSDDDVALLTSNIQVTASRERPDLTLINTTKAGTRTVRAPVPPITGPPGIGADNDGGFLTEGSKPGTILLSARPTKNGPVSIYNITLNGTKVSAERIAGLPAGPSPTSADPTGRDLLLIAGNTFEAGRSYLARSTDYGPPVILTRHGTWFGAIWMPNETPPG